MDEQTRRVVFRLENDIYRLQQQIDSLMRGEGRGSEWELVHPAFTEPKKPKKKKPKLSAWNKFVKANSKKPRFVYKSGPKKGRPNLKKLGVAYRKTPAGRKKK